MDKEKYAKPKIESTDVEIGVYGNGYEDCVIGKTCINDPN